MTTSPETTVSLKSRRTLLLNLLTLPLSYNEIADVMNIERHNVGNDIKALKKHKRMPIERPATDFYAKLILYRDALAKQIDVTHGHHFNAGSALCARIVDVLRESLNIKDVVKTANLMLKGIAMQRMHKLPKELWRTATIWRIALGSHQVNNGVEHSLYWSRFQPAPFVATFTIDTFEEWFGRWLDRTVVTPMMQLSADDLAERFVAFVEFRADPGNELAMIPNRARGWNEQFLHADYAITETTRDIINDIIGESCTHDMVVILDMLAPRSGDAGQTIEQIARQCGFTRHYIWKALNKAFQMIKDQLRKKLHFQTTGRGIDVTDTAHLLQHEQFRHLNDRLHSAETQLAERNEALIAAGLMTRKGTEADGVGVLGEDAFTALCRRVDGLNFGVRAANCLSNAKIEFVWQIVERSEAKMLQTANLGPATLEEIKQILAEDGLSCGMKIPPGIRARLPA